MQFAQTQSNSLSLFSMARSKLNAMVSSGSKDSCSLHRWVLLKNSMRFATPTTLPEAVADPVNNHEDECEEDIEEQDYFSFPDPHSVHDEDSSSSTGNGERQWLDSLLGELEEDDDDDDSLFRGTLDRESTEAKAGESERTELPLGKA